MGKCSAIALGKRKSKAANRYAHLSHQRLEKLFRAVCKLIGSTNFIFTGGSVFINVAPQSATAATPLEEVAEAFFGRLVLA
jgi:hypothetical protein